MIIKWIGFIPLQIQRAFQSELPISCMRKQKEEKQENHLFSLVNLLPCRIFSSFFKPWQKQKPTPFQGLKSFPSFPRSDGPLWIIMSEGEEGNSLQHSLLVLQHFSLVFTGRRSLEAFSISHLAFTSYFSYFSFLFFRLRFKSINLFGDYPLGSETNHYDLDNVKEKKHHCKLCGTPGELGSLRHDFRH